MKVFNKIKLSFNPLRYFNYKRNLLINTDYLSKVKGDNLKEKIQSLDQAKEYRRILQLYQSIPNLEKLPDYKPFIIEAVRNVYNSRQADPDHIVKRSIQIDNEEKFQFSLLGSLALFLTCTYFIFHNKLIKKSIFEDKDEKFKLVPKEQEKKQDKDLLTMFKDLYNRTTNSISSSAGKEEDFNLKRNLTERLKDVKGIDEVREEIEEVVKIMKYPKKYEDAGAKLMKGVLLVGPPGTGKTLLARALAGESGVNFLFTTASEFDMKNVGAGTAKLKKLFQKARENSPCIIFIDEIDSLIDKGKRKGKFSSSADRSDVNTFLSELDGFKKNEHVFVLGATNSINSLDSAALRPGRFDKIIQVPLPDKKGRNEIFSFYLKRIKLQIESDINTARLSEMTPGFSGAEIENMVNLATIMAVDRQSSFIDKFLFEEARDRLILGIKLKSNKNLRYMLQRAVHEAGHAIVCYKNADCQRDIHKVSIAKRGQHESKTSILPDENFSGTKEEFNTYIQVALAGIFAEEMYFGEDKVSVGCGSDLNKAVSLAKDMVKKYAMNSVDFGYMTIDEDEGQVVDHKISSETRNKLDVAVDNIVKKASQNAKEILKNNFKELKVLAQYLIEYDELDREELDKLFTSTDFNLGAEKKKVRDVRIENISI